jgi:hypothetical protein
MALLREETTGAFVGEVPFIKVGRFSAHARIRVFRLQLRITPFLVCVARYAWADSKFKRKLDKHNGVRIRLVSFSTNN